MNSKPYRAADTPLGTHVRAKLIVPQTTIHCDDRLLKQYIRRPWVQAWIAKRVGTSIKEEAATRAGTASVEDNLLGRHAFVCGATGSGKSRAILLLIREHLAHGGSVVLIDPKGETAENILSIAIADGIPPQQTVILDTRAISGIPGWNPLTTDVPVAQAVSDFVSLLAATSTSWGPRLADCLTNALTVVAAHRLSIYELTRFLTREDYREQLLAGNVPCIGDAHSYKEAAVYFEQEFASWTKGERAQAVAPILNKTRELLRSPFLRALVCAESNTLDLGSLWKDQRLIVVRLDRSALGEGAMRVLSGLLTHLLFRTALRSKGDRKVLLCIDELPVLERYVGDVLEDILAVARSMGLRLLAACQHMAQLSGGLRSSLLANSAVKLFFRLGHEDARIVSTHLAVGTEPALVRATVTTDAVDRDTGLPELAQWKAPVLDAGGHRLRVDPGLAGALTLRDTLGADIRQDLEFVSRLAGTQRLYVQNPLTGGPIPLAEYLAGLKVEEFWLETDRGLEIVCAFPRPRISSATKTTEADTAKNWWRALSELPVQHAVIQVASEPGFLIRLRDMDIPQVPNPRRDAFERLSVKTYGQTAGEIDKVLEARERGVEIVARGPVGNTPAPRDGVLADPQDGEELDDDSIF